MSHWLNAERWKSIFLLLWRLHCFLSVTLNRFYPFTGWKGRGLHQHIQLRHSERRRTQEEIVRTKPHRELRSKALKSETCEDVIQCIHWFFFPVLVSQRLHICCLNWKEFPVSLFSLLDALVCSRCATSDFRTSSSRRTMSMTWASGLDLQKPAVPPFFYFITVFVRWSTV